MRRSRASAERPGPTGLRTAGARRRQRYSDEEILSALAASAVRLGRSPTMRDFRADAEVRIHPQTVIERFGTWNHAKRLAGLRARRFATREELLGALRALGDELGRVPTGRDLDERRRIVPSKSLYWHVFGSLRDALREAGFDVPPADERLERAVERGARLARRLGRLPAFSDWAAARRADPRLPSEWQVYRLAGGRAGSWSTFQRLVGAKLAESGGDVVSAGRAGATKSRRERRAARGTRSARAARGRPEAPAR